MAKRKLIVVIRSFREPTQFVSSPTRTSEEFPDAVHYGRVTDARRVAIMACGRLEMAGAHGVFAELHDPAIYGTDNEKAEEYVFSNGRGRRAGELAHEFCKVLREWIGADGTLPPKEGFTGNRLHEVMRRNAAERDSMICHSHDFCDANQAMLDAWEAMTGKEAHITESDERDPHGFFWTSTNAWTIAKFYGSGFDQGANHGA